MSRSDDRPQPAPPSAILVRIVPAVFVLLWSTGFIGAKYGLPYAEPLTFLLLRFVCVTAILTAAALLLRSPWPKSWAVVGRLAVAGALIHGSYLGGIFVAISLGVPAGVAALIGSLQPLLTAAVSGWYLGERVKAWQWVGIVLGLVGVALVVSDKLSFERAHVWGVLSGLIAVVGITAGTLYQRRHLGGMNLVTGSAIQFATVLLVYLGLAPLFETMHVQWVPEFLFALGWLTLVLSIGAVSLFYLMIRHGAAAKVASLFYLVPASTALIAYAVFGETLGWLAIAGMAATAAGVYLVTRA
jgi:drug/metabolite transporter (DMT)-like permease